MERFDRDWLALRAPYDAACRSQPLARAFLAALPRNAVIADLGCGRGANAAYLETLGRRDLRWVLVDGDPAALQVAASGRRVLETQCMDLARRSSLAPLRRCNGVTASALLDLASARWIDGLVGAAASRDLPLLLALSVDGRMGFAPADVEDGRILAAFRRDQRRDKGLGPAVGAGAPAAVARSLLRHGYRIHAARADWRLGAADGGMLDAFVAGIASAAGPSGAAWLRRRRGQIAAGALGVSVGHVDIFAAPRSRGAR